MIKYAYQAVSFKLSWSIMCIQEGSALETCLNSWVRSGNCSGGLLNKTLPGVPLEQKAGYSYESDPFWAMQDWGLLTVGCVAQPGTKTNPL